MAGPAARRLDPDINDGCTESQEPRALHQPGAEPAGVQPAGAVAVPGREHPAAGASEVPLHRQLQPGRVLRDPGGRAQAAGLLRRAAARAGQPHAGGAAAPDQRHGARAGEGTVPDPQRGPDPGAGDREYPLLPPSRLDREAEDVGAALLPPGAAAGAQPHRPGPGPSLSPGAQQEPEFHRLAGGQGCLRPQQRHRHRPGPAQPAPRDPPAGELRHHGARLRLPHLHHPRQCGRAVPGHEGNRLLPVPRHPQQRPVRGRRGGGGPAAGPGGGAALTAFLRGGAA